MQLKIISGAIHVVIPPNPARVRDEETKRKLIIAGKVMDGNVYLVYEG